MDTSKVQDKSTNPDHSSERCELDELAQIVEQQRKDHGVELGELSHLRPTVPHQLPAVEAEAIREQERQYEERKIVIERTNRWLSLVEHRGSRYETCSLKTFECETDYQRKVVAVLREYCEQIKTCVASGQGVLLFGPRGTGKDHLAMAICRAAVRADILVKWQNGMDLFGQIRDSMDGGESERVLVDRLVRPDVLYLSDPLPPIGSLTQFQAAMLFRILDGRYSRRRPLVVTVNSTGREDLDARMGAQNSDRLRDSALAIGCNWGSHRSAINPIDD